MGIRQEGLDRVLPGSLVILIFVPMETNRMKKFIKLDRDTILVLKKTGFFTKCKKCEVQIPGGEQGYAMYTGHNNGLVMGPMVCTSCAYKFEAEQAEERKAAEKK